MNLLQITVEPHVGIYLRHHFGDRILLSERNMITSIIRSLLEPFKITDPGILKGQRKESLGDHIAVYISDHLMRKHGANMDNEAITLFNSSIDLLIKQEMYRWCHHPNADFKQVDYNIKRFINFYGFAEDDLTFDNLKRWYYRERERISQRKVKQIEATLTIPILKTYPGDNKKEHKQLNLF